VRRTAGGTRKCDIVAQKQFFTLQLPIISNVVFSQIRALKEAKTNHVFVYANESGTGDLSKTVAMEDLKWVRMKEYSDGFMWIDGVTLQLEEV
jgi:hypothetical protein